MHTSILYSKESISTELLYSADSNKRIKIKDIFDWIQDDKKDKYPMPIFHQSLMIENPTIKREKVLLLMDKLLSLRGIRMNFGSKLREIEKEMEVTGNLTMKKSY